MIHPRLIFTVLFLMTVSVVADECHDTLFIDSNAYPIPEWWCGWKIDSSDFADPTKLVRLPAELCLDSGRIYVQSDTRSALIEMAKRAERDSVFFTVKSGYRSPAYQRSLIKRRLDSGAVYTEVLKIVAPPGYSEHHTGRALDLAIPDSPFYHSRTYQWLKTHARDFGFVETYPRSDSTVMHWEPWHWYYSGKKN
ncbi:MAG: M15 family metallopeptidase [candidate division Zixibacteria bacterium]|nr:M15 family metallopeptidase [candidate division Zixibacteria bacterium]